MPASASRHSVDGKGASVSAQSPRILLQEIAAQFSHASMILRRALSSWQTVTTVSPVRMPGAPGALEILRDLRMAFAEITGICELLRQLEGSASRSRERVAVDYCESLAQFRLQLPRIQGWLMVEKSRVANRHTHSTSVKAWIDTNCQTR